MRLFERLNKLENRKDSGKRVRPLSDVILKHRHLSQYRYSFDARKALSLIAQQVSFGSRVPGSCASQRCAEWIIAKLHEFGTTAIDKQRTRLTAYNGDTFEVINISARINPCAATRILFIAHWDTRPWADHDPNLANRHLPIDGANDGASGVGVMLELARIFGRSSIDIGLDFLFVDAEDYGQRTDEPAETYDEYSWCLGSQYWLKEPTLPLSKVSFAILLDMVGAKEAVFFREYFSQCAAGSVNDLVYESAVRAGHAHRFIDKLGQPAIDDHIYFLLADIPTIAIIDNNNPATGTFPPIWHTLSDTVENIDPTSLRAVGETLEYLIRSLSSK